MTGLLRVSIREFQQRWVRMLLTLLSIVIGVASVVSISLSTSSARVAQRTLVKAVSGKASLEIQAEGGAAFDESLQSKLREIPDIELLSPSLRRFSTLMLGENRKARIQVLGIDPKEDASIREYKIVQGHSVTEADEVMMDESFAKSLQLDLNAEVKFLTWGGLKNAKIVGLVKPSGVSGVTQGGIVITSLKTAQRWYKSKEKLDSISIVVKEGKSINSVKSSIQSILPTGIDVRAPMMSSQSAAESTVAIENGLMVATVFSLIIAMFIIYNTFQMTVGERRRQFGVLRALGATRLQVIGTVMREALLFAIVGIVFGWGIGIVGAAAISKATGSLLGVDLPLVTIQWYPLILSAVCGLVVTLVGAFFPAFRAGQMQPSEALRVISMRDFAPSSFGMTILGFLILGSGLTILGFCIAGRISIDYASYGLLAFLAGWLLSLPGLLGPLTSLTQALFLRWIPVEGKLARLQLLRHRYRTALTIGVLFVAMSSCLGMANTIMDNIRDIQKWYQRAIVGDFFIRAAMPDMATGMSADMPEDLPGKLAAIPGVEQLDSLRFVKARSGEMTVVVVVREFLSESQDYFDLTDGKPDAVLQGLQEGEVVIASVLAQRAKLGIGDQIPLETLAGPKSMRIVGIANDYIGGGLTLYMTRKLAKELFQVEGSDAYVIQADDRRLPEVEKALMSICKEEGLMLQSYQDLVTYIRTIMNGVTGCLWAVLALGSLIATFGLVNTLAMSILEQTREIGMLRVVAMTRRQIRRMVLAQALQMVWIAIVPGIPAGLIIAYMINLSTLPTTGHAIEFGVRLNLILGAAGFELLLVAVAALIPAERAARIRLADALQYE